MKKRAEHTITKSADELLAEAELDSDACAFASTINLPLLSVRAKYESESARSSVG